MSLAAWRLRHGLALIGDSGSYLAGATGFSSGHWFDTPLVPSFSQVPLLTTVRNAGWSPYTDFGVGLPTLIALVHTVVPLRAAAICVNVLAIGFIAAGVVIGPMSTRRPSELWTRSLLALAVSCWPILRFTAMGVLSEPVFCAAILWIAIVMSRAHTFSGHRGRVPMVTLGFLTVLVGFTRFIGPVVALTLAILMIQRAVPWRRVGVWTVTAGVAPSVMTAVAAGDARTFGFHPLDTRDVFFFARGVGGWLDAGMGDQTSTLMRVSFQPGLVHWAITCLALTTTGVVLWTWLRPARSALRSPFEPAIVLAVTLFLGTIPSMMFLDAILKLDNRLMMPSGILAICAGGWWLAGHAQRAAGIGAIFLWSVFATHPWQWMEQPVRSGPTQVTDAIAELDPTYVLTNQADLVWWHTGIPARYLPTGKRDLSNDTYDLSSELAQLPCALAHTGGIIVIDTFFGPPSAMRTHLASARTHNTYSVDESRPGILIYRPTGVGCDAS